VVAIPPSASGPRGPAGSSEPEIPRSSATPSPEATSPPPLRLRHSLAARITALVVLVLVATGVASLLLVRQLRALQASFDLLTIVYVEFNKDLTDAYRQSARIGVRIELTNERLVSATEETNLAEALETRSDQVQQARAVFDDALAHPERIGGEPALAPLVSLQASLTRLEDLVAQTAAQRPIDVLADVRTQNNINDLFRRLDDQVSRAILDLGTRVRENERDTERMIAMATLAIALLGLVAALGVIWTVRPLRRLALGVRRLGRGDWAQRVAAGNQSGDEVSQLAREFNLMAAALQERERRLIRGERLAAIGQLAAQVTHEIRNPLSSVALNVELLEDEIASASPEARQLLAKITAEIDRLTGITEDYLGFVRRKNPERVPLDLAAELHSLLDFMASELATAGIAVVRDLQQPVWVLGDPGQLRQAFMNLLRNAREALAGAAADNPLGDLLAGEAPEDPPDRAQPAAGQPCVTVRLAREGDRVRAVVADNGPGLAVAADEAEHIFEAFFTRKPQGTGLGLSIVQQIVQDHEGSVRVASTGPQGTSFEIVLPACDPPPPSVSSPGPMPSHRALLVVAAAGLLSGCNFILNPANSDEVTRCKNATECEQNDKFAGILANERTDAACKAPATGSGSFTSAKNNLVCSIVDKASVSCDAEAFPEDAPLRIKYEEATAQPSVYLCPATAKGTTGCPSLNGNCDDPKAKPNDFDICDDGSGAFPFAEPTADLVAQDVLDQHCRSYFCDDNFVCNANKKCVRCRDIDPDETDMIGDGACVDFALAGKVSSIYLDNGCDDDSVSDADETKFGAVVVAP
jgi:two-component system NtrC family sensor kinase